MLRIGGSFSKFIAIQQRALVCLHAAIRIAGGSEGEVAKYLERSAQYFASTYDEHRRLTEWILREYVNADLFVNLEQMPELNQTISDFYGRVEEFEKVRMEVIQSWSD